MLTIEIGPENQFIVRASGEDARFIAHDFYNVFFDAGILSGRLTRYFNGKAAATQQRDIVDAPFRLTDEDWALIGFLNVDGAAVDPSVVDKTGESVARLEKMGLLWTYCGDRPGTTLAKLTHAGGYAKDCMCARRPPLPESGATNAHHKR